MKILIQLNIIIMGLLLLPAVASPVYPVRVSVSGRYLVDQNNTPFLMVGDSPHSLVANLSSADAAFYLADRAKRGFNSLWVEVLCYPYVGGRSDASLLDGTLPFINTLPSTYTYDMTTPNEAYFAHVDQIIQMAATNGIQVVLDPIETGGWLGTMLANGTSNCRTYGQYLGNRYKNFTNIIWISGNDFQNWSDPDNDAVVTAVALGIKDEDTNHLQTVELNYRSSSSLDDPNWAPIVGLNGAYTYYPTYDEVLHAYNQSTNTPVFMEEANYEFEALYGPVTTAPILRQQEYWTLLSGGVAGQLYGNHYTWTFTNGWRTHLDTPGAEEMKYLTALFAPRAWYNLVPDTNHTVVTAGYGTYSSSGYVVDNDYLTAASTPDGTLAIAYMPTARTITVNLAEFSAAMTAQWYDPSSGAYHPITGSPFSNTGSQNFTPPRDGDWILLLTAYVDVTKPTLKITLPTEDQHCSNAVFVVKGTAAPRFYKVTGLLSNGVFVANGTTNDNVAITNVLYSLNGGSWTGASPGNNWSNWMAEVDLTPGTNIFQAYALDSSGNTSLTNRVIFDFVVTNQLLVSTDGLGTVSPNYNNEWLNVGRNYRTKATPGSGFIFSDWTSNLGWVSDTPSLNFMMESNLMLTANFVDVEKPTLKITFPREGQRWSNAVLVADGIANDNVAVAYVLYSLNSSGWTNASTANEWTNWTTADMDLTAGTNIIQAYAVDTSGNVSLTNKVNCDYITP